MTDDGTKTRTIALLVDDHEGVLRSVSRLLSRQFDVVLTASTQEAAEKLLGSHEVTHVVCDYDLGENQPRGTTLLSTWRGQYPSIRRALILTGSQRSSLPPTPDGVDDILDKLCSPEVLRSKLMRAATYLWGNDPDLGEVLAQIRKGSGHANKADDLGSLATLFTDNWSRADGKCDVTLEDIAQAEVIGAQILQSVSQPAQG